MKSALRLLIVVIGLSLTTGLTRAATAPGVTDSLTAELIKADEARLAATTAADAAQLNAIYSDDLRYCHSSGKVDNKASLIESLVSRKTVYESFDVKERHLIPGGPDATVMAGRVLVQVRTGEQKQSLDLSYLSVWRKENGQWRFLAWQSCRNPAPAAKP